MRRPEKKVVAEGGGVTPPLSSRPDGAVLGFVQEEKPLPTPSPRNPLIEMPSYAADRTGAVVEKRGLDLNPADLQEISSEPKRRRVPALASVIVEAVKVDSLQKICSSIEPILRRVVSEELERALAKLGPAMITGRSCPPLIEGPDGRNLQLQFRTRLSLPLFTGGKVEGEQGAAIHVVLLDACTGHLVTSGPESSSKLDVVVLEGDFSKEDDENWSEEEFESNIVKEREGKRPLLTGDMQVSLKEGVGTLGDLTFTDNSSWIRSRKFRLGLKTASGFCKGIRIREGKTEAFTVKDHRGELYRKHYPPALTDEVWRLEKIGKDGSFHKKLTEAGIHTVEDFLKMVVRKQQELRNILGTSMSNKMWEVLVEHAKTCVLSDKIYVYYSDEARNVGVIFNHIYEFCGLIANEQYHPAESLLDNQKVVDSLVKKAYDHWAHVVVYDGNVLFNSIGKDISASRNNLATITTNYPSNNQQLSVPRSMNSLPSTHAAAMVSNLNSGVGTDDVGCGDQTTGYSGHQHDQINFGNASYASPRDLAVTHQRQFTQNNSAGLALGCPQPSNLEFQPAVSSMLPSHLHSYDDYCVEDEIRVRSHELLESEDMQQQLHVFATGGTSNIGNDCCTFPSYMPTPVFNQTRQRPGKAVIGWLKIKAVMRWGIFARKKAAERRSRFVELDD